VATFSTQGLLHPVSIVAPIVHTSTLVQEFTATVESGVRSENQLLAARIRPVTADT
jgi:hypothetical protein